MPTPARLLSTREAAEMVGVHPESVRRWIASGTLRAIDIGVPGRPRLRIQQADLDAFIAARKVSVA